MSDKPSVVSEWIITDKESLVRALDGMRKKRRMSLQDLYNATHNRSPADVIRGRQKNIRSDSLVGVIGALDFELVIREKSTRKAKRRVEILREEAQVRAEQAQAAQVDAVQEGSDDERDGNTGHLKRPLTDEERADAEALLERYGRFE